MTDLPAVYKALMPLYKISAQFEKRDISTAYWARFHCVQQAMKIDSKNREGRIWLLSQMDWLEQVKTANADKEEITNEIVGQAHCEHVALGLFAKADTMDRASQFSINLSRLFYTSSQLMEMLVQFGELAEDFQEKKKYAKWKCLDIKNCLDSGVSPVPGPPGGFEEEDEAIEDDIEDEVQPPHIPQYSSTPPAPSTSYQPEPFSNPAPTYIPEPVAAPRSSGGAFEPSSEQVARAQKLAKFAVSSLDYDDVLGAVEMLQKSLRVLQTGKE